jgi:hypothetical protein
VAKAPLRNKVEAPRRRVLRAGLAVGVVAAAAVVARWLSR